MKTAKEIITALTTVARPEIRKSYQADSCIASTRIAMESLNQFGLVAHPLPVRTIVYNPAFCERIKAGSAFPEDEAELKEWSKQDGSWTIGIGFGANPNKWDAHLVSISNGYLIDLSLDQANRPQHKIELESTFVEINDEFLKGKPLVFEMNKCVIKINLAHKYSQYKQSPDWKLYSPQVINNVVQKMREFLDE